MDFKKILILGGTGMVGNQCLWPMAIKYGSKQCDITNYNSVIMTLQKEMPSVVMLLAAKTALSWCEINPDKAFQINVLGTVNVARACKNQGIKLVFMSSTAVFPNDDLHMPDKDAKDVLAWSFNEPIIKYPLNVYGGTKLLGEQIVSYFCPDALIIRPGRMFGGGYEYDKKFIRVCYESLSAGKEYAGYINHYCSLTYIPDLWETIWMLLQNNISGIAHVVNDSPPLTLYEIALFIKESAQLPGTLHMSVIEQGVNGYIATINQSIRPFPIRLRNWKDAIIEYLEILSQQC